MNRLLLAVAIVPLLQGCDPLRDVPLIEERFITAPDEAMNIDSVATHSTPNGGRWLFATAKEGHLIRIYDANNGQLLRDFGGPGPGEGQFQRPNGVIAADSMLIIVERDNHRVQIFGLPDLKPLANFGADVLVKPYGAYLQSTGDRSYRLYVTDAYKTPDEQVPPNTELDKRVHLFNVLVERDSAGVVISVDATHDHAFGETEGPGVLRVVESIWGDPEYDRLLIAEEDPAGGRVIKVYTMDGHYQGPLMGDRIFRTQPEGIALYKCSNGSGYWITTDQDTGRNVFQLFDRKSLAYIGGFAGTQTRNTDGIWLMQDPNREFPAGALFAVHDDQAVAALDWRDIEAALNLPTTCASS